MSAGKRSIFGTFVWAVGTVFAPASRPTPELDNLTLAQELKIITKRYGGEMIKSPIGVMLGLAASYGLFHSSIKQNLQEAVPVEAPARPLEIPAKSDELAVTQNTAEPGEWAKKVTAQKQAREVQLASGEPAL